MKLSLRKPFGSALVATALTATVAGCSAPADDAAAGADAFTKCEADEAALRAVARIDEVAESCLRIAPPDVGKPAGFKNFTSRLFAGESVNHRGRDAIYAPGDEQWVLGKFAYGKVDKDLKGEVVDVYALRGCEGSWEKLGVAETTEEKPTFSIEGVENEGGRVYFKIPEAKRLPLGRHRVRMVVRGDNSSAEQFIEVLPKGTRFFVTDVDGTLTERVESDPKLVCDEESDLTATVREVSHGAGQPRAHEGVANAFRQLVKRGYRPLYLTARPDWQVPRTRNLLREANRNDGRGDLPQGTVRTTLTLTGQFNETAQAFKEAEIAALRKKGFDVRFGFGNRPGDVAAYNAFQVPFQYYFENAPAGTRSCSKILDIDELPTDAGIARPGAYRIKSYLQLAFDKLPDACASK